MADQPPETGTPTHNLAGVPVMVISPDAMDADAADLRTAAAALRGHADVMEAQADRLTYLAAAVRGEAAPEW